MYYKRIFIMRTVITIGLGVLIAGLALAWQPIRAVYINGVPENISEQYLCIPSGSSFDDMVHILKGKGFINDEKSFRWVAEQMQYTSKIRSGRFAIEPGWNNRQLIQHLRAGRQAPVQVVMTMGRMTEDVAGKVSRFIEADSVSLVQTFNDPAFLAEIGYTPETLMSLFIPNTYEFYWNTTPKEFVQRMIREHKNFWEKDDRLAKARALGLAPHEVYTLASIVERETNVNAEKPTIAGVYLNRLRINMLLQADPTCVFATRDFETRRVTVYHTTYDSPYNTYKYKGLPPGPISMASIPSIDAVLNAEKHNYLYFCARPDESGAHAFAETLAAHNVNAQKFWAYRRQKGY